MGPEPESNATAPAAAAAPLTLKSTTTTSNNDPNPGFGLGLGVGIGAVVAVVLAYFGMRRMTTARADKQDAPNSNMNATDRDEAISTTTGMATQAQNSFDASSGLSVARKKTTDAPGHQPTSLDPLTLDYKDQHRSVVELGCDCTRRWCRAS
jgi:hypothetical protein